MCTKSYYYGVNNIDDCYFPLEVILTRPPSILHITVLNDQTILLSNKELTVTEAPP